MTRVHAVSLIALALLGLLVGKILRDVRPLGQYIESRELVSRIGADRDAPSVTIGKGNLTVVLFTDYQCPACRMADAELHRAAARDGNVRLIYKEWPILGPASVQTATAALAAHRQGIYPCLHRKLMGNHSLDPAGLQAAVEEFGGDWNVLRSDMETRGEEIERHLAANNRDAVALGVRGTPAYLIGAIRIEGALTESEFLRVFRHARSHRTDEQLDSEAGPDRTINASWGANREC